MANLKFPYEGGGALTIDVDKVFQVEASGATFELYYDIPTAAGDVVLNTLTYHTQNPTAQDVTNLESAILNASQTPGSCNQFDLIGDDGTVAYQLDIATPVAVSSAAEPNP